MSKLLNIEIRASKAQLKEIRDKLHELVQSLAADTECSAESDDDPGQGRYRLTLAKFPLDRAKLGPRRKS